MTKMTNQQRLDLEMTILNKYMDAMQTNGFQIHRVDYGDGWEEDQGRRISDEERILFRHCDTKEQAWLFFVYGNHPSEVLCDCSDSDLFKEILAPANAYADRHASKSF